MHEQESVRRNAGTDFVTATEIARELGCDRRAIAKLLRKITIAVEPSPFAYLAWGGQRCLYKKAEVIQYLRPS